MRFHGVHKGKFALTTDICLQRVVSFVEELAPKRLFWQLHVFIQHMIQRTGASCEYK
jgi:hypothetical protein